MANTAGLPTTSQYRQSAMAAMYPTTGLKAALFLTSATRGPSDAAYTTTGEVSGTGYTAGGIAVDSSNVPTLSGAVTHWTPAADLVYSGVSIGPTDAVMIYDTGASDRNLGVFTFGSQTIVSGTLTLSMPTDDSSNALARWSWS